jgi:uncharacterized protein YprB with RNaseH-like and TPR domain
MGKKMFFDIETTSIFSSNGMIVAIGVFDPEKMKEPEVKIIKDLKEEVELLNWFKEKIKDYDVICGWNSKSFDFPFILGRAIQFNLDFSELKDKMHLDLIEISRKNFRFKSNRLDEVCKLLDINCDKEIDGEKITIAFMQALKGDEEALERIKKRCKNDVMVLFEVYKKFEPYL